VPRIPRMIIKGEPAVYHVVSRTVLEGFVIGDEEKDFLLNAIKRLSQVYFAEVLGFCLMGDHFHLLVRMHSDDNCPNAEIRRRFDFYYENMTKRKIEQGQIPTLRGKWSSVSEYVREIKQNFSRYYNRLHQRRGFFWAERFKSVIVDDGEPLINCLAYIDLNPIRAGIVDKPDKYRWCSLGYHVLTHNQDDFLSLDFGLKEFSGKNEKERLKYYRRFVYEKGSLKTTGKEKNMPMETAEIDRFRSRNRYFTDSGIIGTKPFVERLYGEFAHHFYSKKKKKAKTIDGLEGVYSLKRLSEKK
jgi:putative transposase